MSRPEEEAHDLDQRSGELAGAEVAPYSDPTNRITNDDWAAQRDPDHTDPYIRPYERNTRFDERR